MFQRFLKVFKLILPKDTKMWFSLSIKVFPRFHQSSLSRRILLLVSYCCSGFTYLKLLLDNALTSWYAYTCYCLYFAYTCSHLYLIDAFTSTVVVSTSWYTYTWYTYTSRFDYPTLYAYTSRLGYSTVRLYFTSRLFHIVRLYFMIWLFHTIWLYFTICFHLLHNQT